MPIVVQKYGGTSVGDADRIRRVAERVVRTREAGHDVIVVVSAMGDSTDELVRLASSITPVPEPREMDMLLTAGERIAMSLLAIAVNARGCKAASYTGSQAGIITDTHHGKAKIVDIRPGRIRESLESGNVVILAGFQGLSTDYDITTLGRGGSDMTAVAMAVFNDTATTEIYTDVDGVYTADPRIVSDARRLRETSHEEMLELAACGAKVLQVRSVEYARNHGVDIHVRSSFSWQDGTWVRKASTMEQPIISGVAHDTSEGKLVIRGVPDKPGVAAQIFTAFADVNINVDMIVQNVGDDGTTDISCTLPSDEGPRALQLLEHVSSEIGARHVSFDEQIAKVSLIGAGMKTHPGVAAAMFRALSDAGVNIEMISTSTIRISVVVRSDDVEVAVNAIHDHFGLGGEFGALGEPVVR